MSQTSMKPVTWKQYGQYVGACLKSPEVLGKSIVAGALSLMTLAAGTMTVGVIALAVIRPLPIILLTGLAVGSACGYVTKGLYKEAQTRWRDAKKIRKSLWRKMTGRSGNNVGIGSVAQSRRNSKEHVESLVSRFSKSISLGKNKPVEKKTKVTPQNKPKI